MSFHYLGSATTGNRISKTETTEMTTMRKIVEKVGLFAHTSS
jgi:hypothetical protein